MVPSLPRRIVQVFVSPGALFEKLRHEPVWFGILAVSAVVVAAGNFLIPQEVYAEFLRTQWAQAGVSPGASPETAAKLARISGSAGALLFTFVWAFVLAGVMFLAFNVVLGSELTYRHYLSVAAHAGIIGAVGFLVTLPLRITSGDLTLSLSLGTFAWFLEEGYLQRVLRFLDLFVLWGAVVMGLGVSVLDRRRSWAGATAVIVGIVLAAGLVIAIFPGAAS